MICAGNLADEGVMSAPRIPEDLQDFHRNKAGECEPLGKLGLGE
jgi:hypothetical protein